MHPAVKVHLPVAGVQSALAESSCRSRVLPPSTSPPSLVGEAAWLVVTRATFSYQFSLNPPEREADVAALATADMK